jgi:hypothetical protein
MRVRKLLFPILICMSVLVPTAYAATGPSSLSFRTTASHASHEPHAHGRQAQSIRAEARSRQRDATRRAKAKVAPKVAPVPSYLQAIAECESHGDPRAIGGGGAFRGKYQFSYGTWAGVGGTGDPATAPEAEQDMRAAMLYERSGPGQWPVCGQ